MKKNKPTNDEERTMQLLRQALPPIEGEPDLGRDLWPSMLKRLDEHDAGLPWFDWALGAGVMVMLTVFPRTIPVILYYL